MHTVDTTSRQWWEKAYDPGVSLASRIRGAGQAFADRRALRLTDGSWITHGQLHAWAEPIRHAIARSLEERGGGVGCLTQAPEALSVAVVATLTTAHGATMLDPSMPATKNRQSLDDAEARTILTDRATRAYAETLARDTDLVIVIDDFRDADVPDRTIPLPEDGVLTIFTSGSTGRPKGVRKSFTSMGHTSYNLSMRCAFSCDDVYLYVGSPGHIGTLNDVVLSLLNGFAAIPVHPSGIDLRRVRAMFSEHSVNKAAMPPSLLRLLLRTFQDTDSLDRDLMIIPSGEALLRSDVQLFFRVLGERSILWQSYGSTEGGHMCAGFYAPEDGDGTGPLPLNRVASGVEIEILDDDGTPVSPGETGQIRVRTPSLTLGYTHDESQSSGQLGADDRGRYFLTGDRAKLIEPGVFVIEGRADRQVSIHGRRLELGDIESAILRTREWGEACAALVQDDGGRATLIAMVSPWGEGSGDEQGLREHLREELPAFAVPAHIIRVDALPRTTTGKVDQVVTHAAMREHIAGVGHAAGSPPQGPTENWVADAWQVVLGAEARPARDVRFDELGGDSLDAVRLCLQLAEKFSTELGMDFVTGNRTIAAQANALQNVTNQDRVSPRVVQLRSSSDGPICVMLPGAGGHAWVYLPIADALDFPCELLAFNLNFSSPDQLDAGWLADRLLERLEKEDPSRPLVLGGYSRGSLIACELAAACQARGRTPARVALIDPMPLTKDPPRERLIRAARSVLRPAGRKGRDASAQRELDSQIAETRRELARLYRPHQVRVGDAPVSILCTESTSAVLAKAKRVFGVKVSDIGVESVSGLGHLDLMRKRGAPAVAAWLKSIMS